MHVAAGFFSKFAQRDPHSAQLLKSGAAEAAFFMRRLRHKKLLDCHRRQHHPFDIGERTMFMRRRARQRDDDIADARGKQLRRGSADLRRVQRFQKSRVERDALRFRRGHGTLRPDSARNALNEAPP
jgi:hypothetical protein